MVFVSVKSSKQIELSTCFLRFFISDSIARWDANRLRLDCALSAISKKTHTPAAFCPKAEWQNNGMVEWRNGGKNGIF